MIILGIETSCDETGLSIVEASGGFENPRFKLLSEALNSQTEIHKEFGGVFPMMAKREHARNLIPLLEKTLAQANYLHKTTLPKDYSLILTNKRIVLEREPELLEQFEKFIPTIEKPPIDAIAVTYGPGLEPALWVGINFAKALSAIWQIPLIPVNHMEGHIMSVLLDKTDKIKVQNSKIKIKFPALALLISGGHTELVLTEDWLEYKIIGQTRDDAVGEAFDKVARILGLPYPGGPEISRLAAIARGRKSPKENLLLPRPMLRTDDFDFSFSGLKTAVLYMVKKIPNLSEEIKATIAREFEDAVTDVLIAKTKKALEEFDIKTLVLGGGVVANTEIRRAFGELVKKFPHTKLLIPHSKLATDNAVMIAMAGYFRSIMGKTDKLAGMKASGNLKLGS